MDKNLRDSVEKEINEYYILPINSLTEQGKNILTENFGEDTEDDVGILATALCSLIEERDRDSRVDELLTLFAQEGWEELEDYIEKRISQLKDQEGGEG